MGINAVNKLKEEMDAALAASSLLTALDSGKILVGSVGNVPTAVDMSGDATIVASGAVTLKATKSLANVIDDPGAGMAIPVTASGSIAITTAAAETNTLAAPSAAGLLLSLTLDVRVGGDRVITCATTVNQTGNNTLTFGAAGDTILLYSVQIAGVLRWRVAANDGVALSTV